MTTRNQKNKTPNKKAKHADTEKLYKHIFQNSPFAIGIIDRQSLTFLEVNKKAMQLYGYSKKEFLKLTTYDIRIPEQHEEMKKQILEGVYTRDTSLRAHKKKNGEIIYIEPSISEITYKGKAAYLMTIHDLTAQTKMQEEFAAARMSRRIEIQKASFQAQERSRNEIAKELHDNVNQILVASIMFLRKSAPQTKKGKENLKSGVDLISMAVDEIRKLSSALVTPSFKKWNLKTYIALLSQSLNIAGIKTDIHVELNKNGITDGLKINVYRIIQEQFSNIIKHSAAKKVNINITQLSQSLILEIADNGKGFNSQERPNGIGLDNISHRAHTYGGKLTIESSPGNGCKLTVEFRLTH